MGALPSEASGRLPSVQRQPGSLCKGYLLMLRGAPAYVLDEGLACSCFKWELNMSGRNGQDVTKITARISGNIQISVNTSSPRSGETKS